MRVKAADTAVNIIIDAIGDDDCGIIARVFCFSE
jgi:hypothetical protein